MKLLTNEDLENLPALYSTEDIADPVAQVKLFHPMSSATWLLTEYDPKTKVAFGLAHIHESELGYIPMQEIEGSIIFGLKIERDMSFTPKKLSEARKENNI